MQQRSDGLALLLILHLAVTQDRSAFSLSGDDMTVAHLLLCRGGQLDAQLCAPGSGAVPVSLHVLPWHQAIDFRCLCHESSAL